MGSPTRLLRRRRMRCSRRDGDGDVGTSGSWPATLPAGWTRDVDPTTATYGVLFGYGACTPVVAGGAGDSGDVCQWCGDGADGDGGVGSDGGLLRVDPAGPLTPGTADTR